MMMIMMTMMEMNLMMMTMNMLMMMTTMNMEIKMKASVGETGLPASAVFYYVLLNLLPPLPLPLLHLLPLLLPLLLVQLWDSTAVHCYLLLHL